MSGNTHAHCRRMGGLTRLGERVGDRIELALQAREGRRILLALDDGALKDLGLSRGDAYAEATRPVWDVPIDRPCSRTGQQ
jgi:uncharacterized protein YjiS (DUF1127 family)